MRFPVLVEPGIRRHLVALVGLFAVGIVLGAVAPGAVTAPLIAVFRTFVQPFRTLPNGQLFLAILTHNLAASFLTMLGGLLFGILPALSIVANGFLLGLLCRHAGRAHGVAQIIAGIAPHGVFELPAMFIAASYGLWLGTTTVAGLRGREVAGVGERVRHAVRRYLVIVLPLLIVAAAIESTLSPRRH